MSDASSTLMALSMGLELLLTHGGPKSHADIVYRQPGSLKSTQSAQSLATGPWSACAGLG